MQIRLLIAVIPALLTGAACVAAEKPVSESRLNVGILLFEGVELLDFAGPAEVFIVAGQGDWFRIHTIAASKKPLPWKRWAIELRFWNMKTNLLFDI